MNEDLLKKEFDGILKLKENNESFTYEIIKLCDVKEITEPSDNWKTYIPINSLTVIMTFRLNGGAVNEEKNYFEQQTKAELERKRMKLSKALVEYYDKAKEGDAYPDLPTPEDLGIKKCSLTGYLFFENLLKYIE